jgi:sulfatase modifying factor 1
MVAMCDPLGNWVPAMPCPYVCMPGLGCTGVCHPGERQCDGLVPQTCDDSGQWQSDIPCGGATPVCSGGRCVVPSCDGLPATCGASGNDSCCASTVVPGGTYNRSNDIHYPATVSDFRMDKYEITVGRFRKFVEAYPGNKPAAGAGKNPHNPSDPGWDATWDSNLPADQATLIAALKCDATYQTWTDSAGSNENRPINCITWYEAFAFCIWDGGRLPTEAEWNYAAAGGSEQREYPWSVPPSSTTIGCANATYDCANNACGNGTLGCQATDLIEVGTKPDGNGKWAQSDLAGNVWEWVLDWYAPYINTNPCIDCANLTASPYRVARGGSFSLDATTLRSSYRIYSPPSLRHYTLGARCVRSP